MPVDIYPPDTSAWESAAGAEGTSIAAYGSAPFNIAPDFERFVISDDAQLAATPQLDAAFIVTDPLEGDSITATAPAAPAVDSASVQPRGTFALPAVSGTFWQSAEQLPRDDLGLGFDAPLRGITFEISTTGNPGEYRLRIQIEGPSGALQAAIDDPLGSVTMGPFSAAIDFSTSASPSDGDFSSLRRGSDAYDPVFRFAEQSSAEVFDYIITGADTNFHIPADARFFRIQISVWRITYAVVDISRRQTGTVISSPDGRFHAFRFTPFWPRQSNAFVQLARASGQPLTARYIWLGRAAGAVRLPGAPAGGYTPPGIGAPNYHIRNAWSQSNDYLGSVSYATGDDADITIQNLPASWVKANWAALLERIIGRGFLIDLGDGRLIYAWLREPWPVPLRKSSGTYEITLRITS